MASSDSPSDLSSKIDYKTDTHKLEISVNTKESVEYLLAYKSDKQVEAFQGKAEKSNDEFKRDFYAGTCSSDGVCVPHKFQKVVYKVRVKDSGWVSVKRLVYKGNEFLTASEDKSGDPEHLSDDEDDWLNNNQDLTITPTPTVSPTATPTPTSTQSGEILDGISTTATPTPTIVPQEGQSTQDEKLTATVVEGIIDLAPFQVDTQSLAYGTASPALSTDKPDYSPTDSAVITGTNLTPNATYILIISSKDEPAVTHEASVKTDSSGSFTYVYQLDGNYRPNYTVELKNASGVIIASTTFTDSRTINSTTINGGSTVTVAPSTAISAVVNVTTTGSGTANDWNSTGWRISTTAPGTVTCVNHANHTSSGTNNETFNITAPATPGTYNAYFIAYDNDSCSSGASSTLLLSSAVVVTGPDLTATKSNSLGGGNATINQAFTWTLRVQNSGSATATFTSAQELLRDERPSTGVSSYGSPTVTPSGITGTVSCAQSGTGNRDLTCTASGGSVTMPTGSYFDVSYTVTPSATGSLSNPRSGAVCRTDRNGVITESNESNNDCSNTVTVDPLRPDLTITKTNNLGGGNASVGVPFNWIITITNSGAATATFGDFQTVLSDDLPTSGATYGTPTSVNGGGSTGSSFCFNFFNTLYCLSNIGSNVSIPAGGTVTITLPVTPTSVGSLTNPRSGGSYSVDPNNNITESNEGNNSSSTNSVTVVPADSTPPTISTVDSDGQTYTTATTSPHTIKVTFSENISNTPTIAVSGTGQTVTNCGDADSKTFCFAYTIPSSTVATNTVQISGAQDVALNTMVTNNSHTFNVETTVPVITITNPNTSPATSKTISASTSEGTLIQSVTTGSICDNSLVFTSYSMVTFTSETDNGKRVCYQAVDTAGNTAFSLSNAISGIDTTAPTIINATSVHVDGSFTVGEIINIAITFSEAVTSTGNVTVNLDTGGSCTFIVTSSTTGSCNYTVGAGQNSADLNVSSITGTIKDAALNALTNFTPATNLAANKAIVIDTTAPAVPTHVSPSDNSFFTTANLTLIDWSDVTDSVSSPVSYVYQSSTSSATNPDGSFVSPAYTSGSLSVSQISTVGTPEGVYYWHVRAADSLGNTSAWSTPWKVTVDNTAPIGLGSPSTTSPTNSTTQTWNWTAATDSLSGIAQYAWRVAGGASGTVLGTTTSKVTNLLEGIWNFFVKAIDNAGNESAETSGSVTVDTTKPIISGSKSPAANGAGWNNTNVIVSFTCAETGLVQSGIATDSVAGTTLSSDGASQSFTNTGTCVDNAGNTADSATVSGINIDKTAPSNPVASPVAGNYASDQLVTLSSTDATSGVDKIYYTVDGSTPDNTKTEYTGPITVDIDMTIKAIAYDKAGNTSGIFTGTYGVPPHILSISLLPGTPSSVMIVWTTDDPSTSKVVYDKLSHTLGSAPNYGYLNATSETDTVTGVTTHAVSIAGLEENTQYFFRVISHGLVAVISGEQTVNTGVRLAGPSTPAGGAGGGGGVGGVGGGGATVLAGGTVLGAATGGTGNVLGETTGGTGQQGEVKGESTPSSKLQKIGEVKGSFTAKVTELLKNLWRNPLLMGLVIFLILLLLFLLYKKRKKEKGR